MNTNPKQLENIESVIKIEQFDPSKHANELSSWYSFYNMGDLDLNKLPQYGLVAYNDISLLAILFICNSDCKIVWFDLIIGNPKADKDIRSKALDAVSDEMFIKAKEKGYTTILAASAIPAMIDRLAKQFKTCETKASLFMKEI